jgi:flagellar hook-basal body complex protein FliE
MAGINGISGLPSGVNPLGGATKSAAGASGSADFGKLLSQAINGADQDQQNSNQAVQDLVSGNNQDVLPVVAAVAKSDLSFKLLMGIRNKVVEAYKQTMSMQV